MDIKTKIQIIKNEIVKCSMFEYQEIYKIIKSNNSNYSKNINGIFIDLQRLDSSVIDQIYTYIMYCNKLTKNINAYEDIKNNIIKTNFQSLEENDDDIKIETITDTDIEEENSLPVIKNKVSSTMKFYILKKKLTKPSSIFNNQIENNLDYDTPYKT
mgnify:CR=1 FL=1|tara:strand:+ start:390 stop:860 length:471 start_codon:yes stop_codon:yes gene_type:complete